MSLTISGILGIIITQILGESVPAESVATFIDVAGLIGFSLLAWYGRYRQGDVNFFGIKQ